MATLDEALWLAYTPTGSNIVGRAGGVTKIVSAAKTRPNDTNTYASGDVINESTSAGTMMTFSGCARFAGGSGVIVNAMLVDSANQTLKLSLELWLFSATYTPDNDNAAFTPTDAEALTVVSIITFPNSFVGDATSGSGGNVILGQAGPIVNPFVCATGLQDLYGVLVARNAYVPIANEVFTVNLEILQD